MEEVINELLDELRKENPQAYLDFYNSFEKGSCKKGEHLATVGKVCKRIFILKSGIVKHYRVSEEGNEQIIWFALKGDILSLTKSFVLKEISEEGLLALEDCEYISMHRDTCYQLVEKHREIERFYRKLLEFYCISADDRLYFLLAYSAKQRYEYILKHEPHFLQQIPQKELSSFLGITRETLSRIRKFN